MKLPSPGHWRDVLRFRRLYILLLSTLLLSCNLFNTREPENPVSGNQTLPAAFTKEALFSNFKSALEQKNVSEYEKLFADSSTHAQRFTFIPNQSSAARYSAVFSTWSRTMETKYLQNAIAAVNTSSALQFQVISGPQVITFQGDSAHYIFDYLLYVPHNRTDVNTQQFTGRCEITMSPDKNNPIWRIYRWIDFETKKDSSWSELKGQFAK
jgi:hypothetical protein